jgi:hypothetical protein
VYCTWPTHFTYSPREGLTKHGFVAPLSHSSMVAYESGYNMVAYESRYNMVAYESGYNTSHVFLDRVVNFLCCISQWLASHISSLTDLLSLTGATPWSSVKCCYIVAVMLLSAPVQVATLSQLCFLGHLGVEVCRHHPYHHTYQGCPRS